ncbi:MAG: RnfABCDGE type electron transport complex subunit D [Clostridia bacterium]|nr:RnfABCDGE type electron transport complex subunit D [Clostridia bacterium]
MENLKLTVSSTPHVRENNSIEDIMLDVILALMPAAFAGVYFFGARALAVMLVSVISCVGFEALYEKIAHKKVTVNDFSAVVTGMLLAYVLPPSIPYFMVIIGAFVAIVITKQLFGGLGQNFMNPALIGRAFLMASFPVAMTTFTTSRMGILEKSVDAVTGATVLSKEYQGAAPTLFEAFIGKNGGGTMGGCIGETCAAALLIGFVYLIIRRVITLHIPLSYLGTMVVMALLFGETNPLMSIFTGGVMLGAIFMATDYVTTPTTPVGQIIFGIGCGLLTSVIRFWGGYPEGVTYAILLMNVITPLLDKWTAPKAFGAVKSSSEKGLN